MDGRRSIQGDELQRRGGRGRVGRGGGADRWRRLLLLLPLSQLRRGGKVVGKVVNFRLLVVQVGSLAVGTLLGLG